MHASLTIQKSKICKLTYLAEATLESKVLKVTRILEIFANENPRTAAIAQRTRNSK